MLVLANEMFNCPPVFAWVLPVFVRFQPRQGGNFFFSVTVTYFVLDPGDSMDCPAAGKGGPFVRLALALSTGFRDCFRTGKVSTNYSDWPTPGCVLSV